ncbi:hypothetical protein [uncultured Arenimonas sp.]|uniref:hypothetical protein n=1 Tax=uncultured Arenimonas sp. TaxID=546226 RepID=UPI0030D9BB5C
MNWAIPILVIGTAMVMGVALGLLMATGEGAEIWAQIAGAALGAFIAVLGAFALGEVREAKTRRLLRDAVVAAVDAIASEARGLAGLRRDHQNLDVQYMFGRSHAEGVVSRLEYLERFGPCLELGDYDLLRALAEVRARSRRIGDILQVMHNEPPVPIQGMQIAVPVLKDNRVRMLEAAGEQLATACDAVTTRIGQNRAHASTG